MTTDKELTDFFDKMIERRFEVLHEDLEPYIFETDFGPCLKHPLVFEVPLFNNGSANDKYEWKKKRLQEAQENKDWHTAIFLHERPFRCEALIEYVVGRDEYGDVLPVKNLDAESRELVSEVWTDSENIHQHIEDWNQMIEGWVPGDPLIFGTDTDREKFADLPNHFVIWRGDCDDGRWSWTTDKKVALFFAKRFDENHALLSGIVDKRNVFGYLLNRSEAEVMVHYENVYAVKEHPYE